MNLASLVPVLNLETVLGLCFLLWCCSIGSNEVHCSGSYSFRLVLLFHEDLCCCLTQIPLCPARLCNLAAQVFLCLLPTGTWKAIICSCPQRLQCPCFPASHGWLLVKGECCTHHQVLAASATKVASPHQPSSLLPRGWHSFHHSHSPSACRATLQLVPWWHWHVSWCEPKATQADGLRCSTCVQQGWCICKTGARFPRRRAWTHLLNPRGYQCMLWSVFPWLFLLLFSAVTKIYISSFSYLCRRPNLQNAFSILLVFFENGSIKSQIARVYTEEPASWG